MKKLIAVAYLIGCAFFSTEANARTYYLPDYQDGLPTHERINDKKGNSTGISCSTYGYYSAADRPSGAECSRASVSAPGLECYECSICSASFAYDSSNCSGNYVTSGSSCGGKYAECVCNPNLFPASSSGNGCSTGQKADTTASCTNKSDNNTFYKCEDDACYGLTSKADCEAAGKYCAVSSQCSDSCEKCVELCEGYKTYEGAIDNCSYGCAPGKSISGCPNLCEAGGCKSCTPCSSDYVPLSEISSDATMESCTDCDGTTKYRATGCKVGYTDANTYWCDLPQSTDCKELGYQYDSSQNAMCNADIGQIAVHCPFDYAYVSCL